MAMTNMTRRHNSDQRCGGMISLFFERGTRVDVLPPVSECCCIWLMMLTAAEGTLWPWGDFWDLAKAWRKHNHCVCGVEEALFSVRICFLKLELIMGLSLLAVECLSQAFLKIQPRFIYSRVSTTWWCLLLVQGFVSWFQTQNILLRPWEVSLCNVLSHILWPYASICPEMLMRD